jgi:hypothetical protein
MITFLLPAQGAPEVETDSTTDMAARLLLGFAESSATSLILSVLGHHET